MADNHVAHTADRIDNKAGAAAEMKNDPLVAQWLELHSQSQGRNAKDNDACADAKKQDEESIKGRDAGTLSAADKVKGDRDDLQGDFQAIGKHKGEHGDDQKNRDDDMKIVGVDREILKKYGSHLSAEQKQAINEDITAKLKTAQNSNSDIAQENKYIQGDKNEMATLRSGTPEQIEAANQKQTDLRKQDAQLEKGYIDDNNRSIKADDKVLKLFGAVDITGSK